MSHGNNESEIGRRYVNAVETRGRVSSPLLRDVIGHLENLVTSYQRLKAVLAVDLIEHTTSVPGQILESVNTIVQQTQDSLEEFRSEIVDRFTDYYEENADALVAKLVESAKHVLNHHYYFATANVNESDSSAENRLQKIFDHASEYCRNLEAVFNATHRRTSNFSTRLYVRTPSCSDMELLLCRVPGRLSSTENSSEYTRRLFDFDKVLTSSARTVLKCIPMYGKFLLEVDSWLKFASAMNSSLPLRPQDHRQVLVQLELELNWMKTISHRVAEESLVR